MEERLAVANKEIEDKEECLSVLNVVAEEDHKTCVSAFSGVFRYMVQHYRRQFKCHD